VANAPTGSLDRRAITFEWNMLQRNLAFMHDHAELGFRPSIEVKFHQIPTRGVKRVAFTRISYFMAGV